ncbi:hypothetical protein [Paenibacillus eucommiae]|uniref:YmcC n=1 Tax=Paenibacillus eucommiae TaxID=1355755 RepID=A0ABS4J4Z8_9BACL|nr:hypothetical protein [Paenibacillus eucommiae]MBP1994909.1 hypothetical protein [Paenibacillus eucommiae]
MIVTLIISCEIAFWLFILAGLVCRYILKLKKVGTILLLCTPIIDLVLLIATGIDLRRGAEATFVHSLAAIYIGVSIAFGHRMIKWADQRFAHRFAGGPAPTPKPKSGRMHARHERIGWLHHLLAWAIGCAFLYVLIVLVGDGPRTLPLLKTIQLWSVVLGIDFLISFSYTLWPRESKKAV